MKTITTKTQTLIHLSYRKIEMKRNYVTLEEVSTFKDLFCDENSKIADILSTRAQPYLVDPILDMGAGKGDICFNAFPDREVFLLDINDYSGYPIRDRHQRYIADFFDFVPPRQIGSLLMAHSLQFVDDDLELLNHKVEELSPKNILLFLNENDGLMGKILAWTKENIPNANPEEFLAEFPRSYTLVEKISFQARVYCEDFSTLAKQVAYLMLFDLTPTVESKLTHFLRAELREPCFFIRQALYVYTHKKTIIMASKSDNLRKLFSFISDEHVREKLLMSEHRIRKSFDQLFSGYALQASDVLNDVVHVENYTGIVCVKDINFYTFCEHHFAPFFGTADVYYQPNKIITGLGKLVRLVRDVHGRRLQIQETMTRDIAEDIMRELDCKGVFVQTRAKHMCMCSRGPSDDTAMTTVNYGIGTLESWTLKQE